MLHFHAFPSWTSSGNHWTATFHFIHVQGFRYVGTPKASERQYSDVLEQRQSRFVSRLRLERGNSEMVIFLLVRAKRRVAGWVAGGLLGLIVSQWIIPLPFLCVSKIPIGSRCIGFVFETPDLALVTEPLRQAWTVFLRRGGTRFWGFWGTLNPADPSGNQTWHLTIRWIFPLKPAFCYGIFQLAPFEQTGGYPQDHGGDNTKLVNWSSGLDGTPRKDVFGDVKHKVRHDQPVIADILLKNSAIWEAKTSIDSLQQEIYRGAVGCNRL
jgi:hypothetical protein